MEDFLRLIINSCEKKAKEENMTSEEKKEYINRRLFEHFERNGIDEISDDLVKIYKKVYPEFSRDDFAKYVVLHTKNKEVIFNEKIRLMKKIEKIDDEIYKSNRELGLGIYIQKEDRNKYLFGKIEQVKGKYEINPNSDEKLTQEQIQENIEIIQEMVDAYEEPKQLHQVARQQMNFFTGMKDYQDILKEKSPEYEMYVAEELKKEITPLKNREKQLKNRIKELKELKDGFKDCITNIYDPLLDRDKRGMHIGIKNKNKENKNEKIIY